LLLLSSLLSPLLLPLLCSADGISDSSECFINENYVNTEMFLQIIIASSKDVAFPLMFASVAITKLPTQ